jgi:hypothetical protein
MTMRWMEGYESRLHETLQAETYGQDGTGGYSGAAAGGAGTAGRKMGKSMRMSDNSTFLTPVLVASPTNTWIVQFAVRKGTDSTIAGSPGVKFFKQASGLQMEVRQVDGARTGTYALEAFRGVTSLGKTQDYAYGSQRTWMCFQIKVVIDTTVGVVNIKAWDYFNNSSTDLNLTSQNTADQGSAGMDQVGWSINSQLDTVEQWDDIVIMDDAGAVNNAQTSVPFLVFGALPAGDGPTTDWDPSTGATNWNLLASVATAAGNAEEVTSDTVTNLDQYDFADIPEMSDAGTPAIAAMMVDIHGAMKNSGTRTLRVNVDDPVGGNADVATDLLFSNLVVTARTLIMEDNPVSAAAWTLADLEDHYIGFKLHA